MLEAVASHDLWIWHAFFGVAGANNDINVLDNSPLFDDLLDDKAPLALFVMTRWDEIRSLPVQNPSTMEFASCDLVWSKIEGPCGNLDRLALIPFHRVDDFVHGESSNKDCPTRFHVEARRKHSTKMPYKPKADGILEYILFHTQVLAVSRDVIGHGGSGTAADANAMALSLHHGQRIVLDQVGGFADGVAVNVGKHNPLIFVKRITVSLLGLQVDTRKKKQYMFEEKRSIQPAGALALAGAKAYCRFYNLKDKNVVAVTSGPNMNFDRLRLVRELANIGHELISSSMKKFETGGLLAASNAWASSDKPMMISLDHERTNICHPGRCTYALRRVKTIARNQVKAGSTYHSCVVVKNMQRCIYAIPSDSVFEDPVIAKHEQDVKDSKMLPTAFHTKLHLDLHGLANQEVLLWIKSLVDEVGENVSKDQLKDCLENRLSIESLSELEFDSETSWVAESSTDRKDPKLPSGDASRSNYTIVIDMNNPLYLHSNETNDGTCVKPDPETSPFLDMQWERCNAVVLSWILNCVSADLFVGKVFSSNAKNMWDELGETYDKTFSRRSSTSFVQRSRDNRRRFNNSTVRNNNLVSKNCNMTGHTIEQCFELIGYPLNFKKKVVVSQNVTSNASTNGKDTNASGSMSHTLTSDQYQRLMSLLGDSGSNNGIQANVAVPDYQVSLLSVHKLAKDSKLSVCFNENECVVKDSFLKSPGTGQRGGLGHLADQVLGVLKNRIDLKGIHTAEPYEVCHGAKQTREPFPLSEHKTSSLGELVHLDVWGPYRVTRYITSSTPTKWGGRKKAQTSLECCPRKIEPCNDEGDITDGGGINSPPLVPSEDSVYHSTSVDPSAATGSKSTNISDVIIYDPSTEQLGSIIVEGGAGGEDATLYDDANISEGEGLDLYNLDLLFQNDIDGKVRYGINQVVNYCNLSVVKFSFATGLNKTIKPKSYKEAVQDNINNAFLYGDLEEEIYMTLLKGYFSPNDKRVCELQKSVYGLKQAPRKWNEKLTFVLCDYGFKQSKNDFSLYTKCAGESFVVLLVYVDDILITGNDLIEIEKCKDLLNSKFLIKDLGELKYFLGIEVIKNDCGICLSQRKYNLELLSEFCMFACKPSIIPLYVSKNKNKPVKLVDGDEKLLDNLIDMKNAFKVLRYIKHSPGKGIQYSKSNDFQKSKRQTVFSKSYAEAEFRAMSSVACEIIWILRILTELNVKYKTLVDMFCDNNAAIANPVFHERIKHFEIDLFFLREKISEGIFKTIKVKSENNVSDLFTKGFPIQDHKRFFDQLHLVDHFQA
ncbi:putative RNA-directed DNA polymerase [Tanacetum coccineum]